MTGKDLKNIFDKYAGDKETPTANKENKEVVVEKAKGSSPATVLSLLQEQAKSTLTKDTAKIDPGDGAQKTASSCGGSHPKKKKKKKMKKEASAAAAAILPMIFGLSKHVQGVDWGKPVAATAAGVGLTGGLLDILKSNATNKKYDKLLTEGTGVEKMAAMMKEAVTNCKGGSPASKDSNNILKTYKGEKFLGKKAMDKEAFIGTTIGALGGLIKGDEKGKHIRGGARGAVKGLGADIGGGTGLGIGAGMSGIAMAALLAIASKGKGRFSRGVTRHLAESPQNVGRYGAAGAIGGGGLGAASGMMGADWLLGKESAAKETPSPKADANAAKRSDAPEVKGGGTDKAADGDDKSDPKGNAEQTTKLDHSEVDKEAFELVKSAMYKDAGIGGSIMGLLRNLMKKGKRFKGAYTGSTTNTLNKRLADLSSRGADSDGLRRLRRMGLGAAEAQQKAQSAVGIGKTTGAGLAAGVGASSLYDVLSDRGQEKESADTANAGCNCEEGGVVRITSNSKSITKSNKPTATLNPTSTEATGAESSTDSPEAKREGSVVVNAGSLTEEMLKSTMPKDASEMGLRHGYYYKSPVKKRVLEIQKVALDNPRKGAAAAIPSAEENTLREGLAVKRQSNTADVPFTSGEKKDLAELGQAQNVAARSERAASQLKAINNRTSSSSSLDTMDDTVVYK